MKTILRLIASMFIAVAACHVVAHGQVSSTAPLSGSVVDPVGAVIPDATVEIKNNATNAVFKTTTARNGTFTVPALATGTYTVTVTASGFKQAVLQGVKLDAATPASVHVTLEVGAPTEVILVQGGGEVLQTQSATISTTITGREITELPFTSRDGLDLVLFLPGTTTPGRPRTSTINGLPKSALNITMDGLNVQDNNSKATDGFFTFIRPRIDAVEEVTVSTTTPGADSSAEGAVQVKFVTRRGDNEIRGSVFEYHRNPSLNANYWFNNRDLPPDPRTGKAPRDRVLLNQFGFRVGGPIMLPKLFDGRDRAFFFVNYEQFRLPDQVTRNRTVLSPQAQQGIFRYRFLENNVWTYRQVNLLELAGGGGQVSTIDPTIGKLLADIRQATTKAGRVEVIEDPNLSNDPNLQRYTFTNSSFSDRHFPTIRFDFNLTSKHQLESIYNYQEFDATSDFLNGVDPAFPDFPNRGSQISNRFSYVIALRSTLTSALVNEARFGLRGGTSVFRPELGPGQFTGSLANQAGFNLGINAAGITNATVTTGSTHSNGPVRQFTDTVNWQRGSHNVSFGGSFTQVNEWSDSLTHVPTVTFGVDTSDPADSLFSAANRARNFPGASAADVTRARNMYAVLTGRVISVAANAWLNDGQYVYQGHNVARQQQREMGFFVQDAWRMKPNFTLNYGLRWEIMLPFRALNNRYTQTTVDGLFGVSGRNGLFRPGVLEGQPTQFVPFEKGATVPNTDWNNFGPSLGFAWSPKSESGWLSRLFGSSGRSVLRAGFSIAFNRENSDGLGEVLGDNPGAFVTATRSIALGNLVTNTGTDRLPVLLRERDRLGPPPLPSPSFPLMGAVTNEANAFDPNLKMPYVMSWTLGLQREITKNMVVEVRYVGNRGLQSFGTRNFNETNIVENGLLDEFKLAMANLRANIAAGRGNTFRYFGPGTGTFPLPITLAYFSGLTAAQANDQARYTSSLFSSSTFVNPLAFQSPAPFTYAANLHSDPGRRANALRAGLPPNFFIVNPDKRGGANLRVNAGHTYYDAGVVELRRRMSQGLLMQGSYSFARGFSLASPGLRAPRYKTANSLAITHALKADWIYELPVGRGQMLFNGVSGVLDKLVSGWAWHGTARIQTGPPLDLTNVRLIGMTRKDLQKALKIRKEGSFVYYLPQDIIDNTIRAFNADATNITTGYSSRGVPTGRYIAPANNADCIEVYDGQCGNPALQLYGPSFTRFDLSVVKRTRISERADFEFRVEFLNAFNNINFSVGNPANDATNIGGFAGDAFGRVTNAYRDLSTTNDPGGRLIQFVARINF
jgi:hypothetical protein